MSKTIGSGVSDEQYRKDKNARDSVERNLIKNGWSPEKARRIADETANRVTNKRKEK